jgi:hydrogenase maturation protease
MNNSPRILIAGIGNIFLGDDAFGVEVVQRLAKRCWPDGVRVVDFGIRGIDLTYALMDGCEVAILVDAVPRGQTPGTIYLIEPEPDDTLSPEEGMPLLEAHNLDPAKALRLVRSQGGLVRRVLLVGCEPSPIDSERDIQMELSPPVLAAVDRAADLVESLVRQIIGDNAPVEVAAGGVA